MTPVKPPDSTAAPAPPVAGGRRGDRAAGSAPGRTEASAPRPPRGALAETSPHGSADGALAGTPDPVTGAADGRVPAPGRERAPQAPAGAPDGVLAGSKSATGREAYELARRKAQARRPADPQLAPGRAGAPARVAVLMRPCATVLPGGGVCGATGLEHDTGTRGGVEVRTRCSIATAAGPCGCRAYVPQAEAPGGAA